MQTLFHRRFSRAAVLAAVALALAGFGLAISGPAAQGPFPTNSFSTNPVPSAPPLVSPDANATPAVAIQPMAVQALDATHFVVVTREPRLVTQVGQEGRAMNMILHVVTYYSVQDGRLIPIEHVHVPPGYRAVTTGE